MSADENRAFVQRVRRKRMDDSRFDEHVAIATAAALKAEAGVYRVVDDDPSDRSVPLPAGPAVARFLDILAPQEFFLPATSRT